MKLFALFFFLLNTNFLISQFTLKHTILCKNKDKTIQLLSDFNSRVYPKGNFAYGVGFNISNRANIGFLRNIRKDLLLQIDNFVSEIKVLEITLASKVFNSK